MRGTLYIVSAPSGAGKSSIVNRVLARDPGIDLSISFTSRAPRPGERHAEHYHFVDEAEFQRMIAAGDFFEHALVHGDWKGTARQSVEPMLAAGRDVLREIDWQGARQVRRAEPAATLIFLLPPSWDELVHRLVGRGTEDAEERARRLRTAKVELAAQNEFDHLIVNEDVATAAREVVELSTSSAR